MVKPGQGPVARQVCSRAPCEERPGVSPIDLGLQEHPDEFDGIPPLGFGRHGKIRKAAAQVGQPEPLGHLGDLRCCRIGLCLAHLH